MSIDFDDSLIGQQSLVYSHDTGAFEASLADARTFCMLNDVEAMRNSGLARGGSLDNAVVVHDGSVLNDGGLRSDDEFVRHKALDCLGDLYLFGMADAPKLTASRPGHALSTKLLQAVMARPDSFVIENRPEPQAPRPGPGHIPKQLWLHIPDKPLPQNSFSHNVRSELSFCLFTTSTTRYLGHSLWSAISLERLTEQTTRIL